jgi:hypothetical protein
MKGAVMGSTWRRTTALGIGVLVVAGLSAGVVVAGQFAPFGDSVALEEKLRSEPMTRVADIPGEGPSPARGVYVQETSDYFCYWDAPSATSPIRQGGCNAANEPLGGRPMAASLAYEGGPSARSVTDARIVGLAESTIATIKIVMSDGSARKVALRSAKVGDDEFRAFGYRIRHRDLREGLGPIAVVALDANGIEVHRQPTGFAG